MLSNTFTIGQDGYGTIGLIPKEGTGFNAFTNWVMLFHDVMEHYFEGLLLGEATVAGEIIAMGHCLYYTESLGLACRIDSFTSNYMAIANTTINFLTDKEEDATYPIKFYVLWDKKPKTAVLDDNDEDIILSYILTYRKRLIERAPQYLGELDNIEKLTRMGYAMAKAKNLDLTDIYKIKDELEDLIKQLNLYGLESLQGCTLKVNVRKHKNTFKVSGTLKGEKEVRYFFKNRVLNFPIEKIYPQ